MNTVRRAPSHFVGLFNRFPTRASVSQLFRSQDVTPAPIVQAPGVTPASDVSIRANDIDDSSLPSPSDSKTVSETSGQDLPHSRRGGTRYAAPRSALWAARRLQEDKPESAIAILRNWTHNRRYKEATHEMVATLNAMEDDLVIQALCELKLPLYYVRSSGRRQQTLLPVTLHPMELPRREIPIHALLDSGCTGSCIDEDFVRQNGIVTRKTALPIPVYNADGSTNANGSITEFVDISMSIGNHQEQIALAVAKLGTAPLFIGHEWLRFHNPTIDWSTSTVKLDRCPALCTHMQEHFDEEEEQGDPLDLPELEEGERLFAMDWNGYVKEGAHLRATSTHSSTIAQEQAKAKKEQTFAERVPSVYHDFRDLFDKDDFDKLPEHRPWDHVIELIKGARPVDCKVYPLTLAEQEELNKFLEENLRTGRIRPSKSPMASPFFFIKKKDGSLRPVQDYRKLNDMTIKNRYPLPLIQELLDKLKGARHFTKLDVRWGYNNVRIAEGDEWKAAFRTNAGLFEPTVMFFGLTNSPATFQAMMNELFRDLIHAGVVVVYLDDILIFTKTLEEHRRVTREVLRILRENKLYLKPEKCEFERPSIEYLGMIVEEGRVRMDPAKVAAVADWAVPRRKKELQSFLGFCNFYRRFIKDFSRVARPLHRLTGDVEWEWGLEQQLAFDELKLRITSEPVLIIPTDDGPFRVEADASNFATGAVLSQKGTDGKWHPVAYHSKSLSEAERNYEIYDKELLAIVLALEEWRQYLLGARHTFKIWSDHLNLTYFREAKKLNRRQARWFTELQEYDFTLHHMPGSVMGRPDAISRKAGLERGEKDNEGLVMLKPELFRYLLRATALDFDGEDEPTVRRIKDCTVPREESVDKALLLKNPNWKEHPDGLLTHRERIYVPPDEELRADIIKAHHDTPIAGHPGRYKTQELITRTYWWPGIRRDVTRYVEGCQACQRVKYHRESPHAPLQPNEVPTSPFEVISMDFIGPLPECEGYDMVLNVNDHFSRRVICIPCRQDTTSEDLAQLLIDHVYSEHGLPRKIISDRGSVFVSNFTRALMDKLGIQGNPSTAYHPQTDGLTERYNQELKSYLRLYVDYHQTDWVKFLKTAQFSYNNTIHSAHGHTPFYASTGRHPYSGLNPRAKTVVPAATDFATHLKKVQEEVKSALNQSREEMKATYDLHRQDAREYEEGDLVWLEGTNLKSRRPSQALNERRYGPFKVLAKIGASAYKLEIPETWKVHDVFNESLLTPYRAPAFRNQEPPGPPPMELIDDEAEYVVDYIIKRSSTLR